MSNGPDDALAAHELDLVGRAAKGDTAAFDRFFERNAPAVQLLAERLLGPGEAADAVVVEAFEKTVRRLPLLGARNSSPALYVLSTARNGAYAALGRGRPTADGGPLSALLALPSRQRELLALRELGLPEAACAEVAGIDASEVGPQVARARLRLTDELEGSTLSTVFADDRAERLLAAEVVRVEGQPVPEAVAQEISTSADGDARFAAALSAVRSPSRSIGQLPAVSGPARLAASARDRAVVAAPGAGRAAGAAAASAGAAAAAAATPAAAAPQPPRRPRSDPYDAEIGDELAWGIVDDEDGDFTAGTVAGGGPAVDDPTDGQWADGAGGVSSEAPTELQPPAHPDAPVAAAGLGAAASGSSPQADPFAGWDDALDWDEDEKAWAAGSGAPAPIDAPPETPAAAAIPEPIGGDEDPTVMAHRAAEPAQPRAAADLGETRAFDAVAAGLVDADPIPLSDFDHGDEPPAPGRRRRIRRILIWLVALILLFAGTFVAVYAYVAANQDPDVPPSSQIDETPTPTATPTPSGSSRGSNGSSSSSSKSSGNDTPKRTTSGSGSSSGSSGSGSGSGSGSTSSSSGSGSGGGSSSSSGSGSGGSSSSGSGSGGGSSSGGSTSGGSGGSGGTSTGGGNAGTARDDSGQVTSGESNSGGAVRGGEQDGGSGGTTP